MLAPDLASRAAPMATSPSGAVTQLESTTSMRPLPPARSRPWRADLQTPLSLELRCTETISSASFSRRRAPPAKSAGRLRGRHQLAALHGRIDLVLADVNAVTVAFAAYIDVERDDGDVPVPRASSGGRSAVLSVITLTVMLFLGGFQQGYREHVWPRVGADDRADRGAQDALLRKERAQPLRQGVGFVGGGGVLHRELGDMGETRHIIVEVIGAGGHRAQARERGDYAVLHGEDGLHIEQRAEQALRPPDAPALGQVLEGVEVDNDARCG